MVGIQNSNQISYMYVDRNQLSIIVIDFNIFSAISNLELNNTNANLIFEINYGKFQSENNEKVFPIFFIL